MKMMKLKMKNTMYKIIDEWIEMLEDEETEYIEQVDIDTITVSNQSLNELLTQDHHCLDCNAKWLLENLFNSELETPIFANINN